MSRLPVHKLRTNTQKLDLGDAQVIHLPNWNALSHPERLGVMRQISMMRGRDPRIAKLAVSIFKASNIQPREYAKQAASLLAWVQNPKNVFYVNEPGERLQDPIHTIKVGHGDCFAENTLVLREDMTYVKIQDVQVGSRIWGRDRWSTIVNFWDKGTLPVTEIDLNNGSTLRLTENHKVYVLSCPLHGAQCPDLLGSCQNCASRKFSWERITVAELTEKMVILQPEFIEREEVADLDADTSWLIGAYVAEGWAENSRIMISGKDGHWKEQTKHRVKSICDQKGWATRWNAKYIAINDINAVQLVAGCGSGAVNKVLTPEILQTADLDSLDVGLRLDSSQNTRGEGWTYGTTSLQLALQYRTLQRMLGRSTSWRKVVDHGGFGKNPIYRVGVRNPKNNNDRRLKVKAIRRHVESVPCYDIATDDHYVYLPEADCTVSNCDDQSLLLTCLFESVGLPWKFVLSGRDAQGNKVRYIEGEKVPPGSKWSHIYCMVGTPPFQPSEWYFCETTVVGVPLGWDVISGDHSYLPEMAKSKTGKPQIMVPGPANGRYRPSPLPPAANRSPAYQEAMGGLGDLGDNSSLGCQASNVAQAAAQVIKQDWKAIAATAIIGAIASNLALQYFNGEGVFAGGGHFFTRWGTRLSNVAQNSKLFPKIL